MVIKDLQHSDYRIRKLIGALGILLPISLPLTGGEILSSISHYYYITSSSLVFIIVLSAFALFLISYKGYKIDEASETISDDILTNIGGFAALIVVLIPTKCSQSGSLIIESICESEIMPLYGHLNQSLGTIHLICAGIFILCMGWMSKYKFTRGSNDTNNKLYNYCGNLVFISVGLIIIFIILEKLKINFPLKDYYVFIFETIAVISFGISWLVKGKAIDNAKDFAERIFKNTSTNSSES